MSFGDQPSLRFTLFRASVDGGQHDTCLSGYGHPKAQVQHYGYDHGKLNGSD
jgi:hypothetical protein